MHMHMYIMEFFVKRFHLSAQEAGVTIQDCILVESFNLNFSLLLVCVLIKHGCC